MSKELLSIGKLDYLNNYPVYYAIENNKVKINANIIEGNPSFLNKEFDENKLDITPISVVQYLKSIKNVNILNNLSISSEKEVGSIFLFSKYPISKLSGKKIAITTSSATSVMLLRILLKHVWNIECELVASSPNIKEMLRKNDAALLIGDDALKIIWGNSMDLKKIYIEDLGKAWNDWTNLPMVYAVWAYKKDIQKDKILGLNEIKKKLIISKNYGIENISKVIEAVHKNTNFSKDNLKNYYNCLSFNLNKDKIEGLLFFVKLAVDMNLLSVNIKEVEFELFKSI